jgi:type IV fimbrial biogenesis protein FimT
MIELLVTVSIAAILLTLAVPNFRDFLLNSRLSSQALDLVTALNYAKSEATKRNVTINVCKNADAVTVCTGAATGWSNGWQVVVDNNNDCDGNDAGETVLKVWPALEGNTLCYNGATGDRIRFQNTGFTPGFAGTYRFCDSRGTANARSVTVSLLGRTSSTGGASACP